MIARAVLLAAALALFAGVVAAASPWPAGGGSAAAATPAELRSLAARATALVDESRRFGYRVVLRHAREDERARLDSEERTITLFIDPRDAPHRIAHDLAHELGHAYDLERMSAADRALYLARRGRPGAAWWTSPGNDDYTVGAGDFAETFARCHAASPEFRSNLGPAPADACGMLPPDAR